MSQKCRHQTDTHSASELESRIMVMKRELDCVYIRSEPVVDDVGCGTEAMRLSGSRIRAPLVGT